MPRVKRFPLPTQERLKELFDYDPATGVVRALTFRRHGARGRYEKGDVIGYPDANGYLKATVDGKPYALHRVVWKWMTGDEPPEYLDHKNRVRHDNSWANLRAADASLNGANKAVRRPSGSAGVRPGAAAGTWFASFTHRGEHYHLGTFSDEESALAAYRAKVEEIRPGFQDETPYAPAAIDLVILADWPLLEAAAFVVRRVRALSLHMEVSPALERLLEPGVADLANHLARAAPEKFSAMARNEPDIPSKCLDALQASPYSHPTSSQTNCLPR